MASQNKRKKLADAAGGLVKQRAASKGRKPSRAAVPEFRTLGTPPADVSGFAAYASDEDIPIKTVVQWAQSFIVSIDDPAQFDQYLTRLEELCLPRLTKMLDSGDDKTAQAAIEVVARLRDCHTRRGIAGAGFASAMITGAYNKQIAAIQAAAARDADLGDETERLGEKRAAKEVTLGSGG